MTCPFSSDQLCAWVHGEEENAALGSQIEAHIGACPSCRALVGEMRGVLDGLRSARGPAAALPDAIGRYRITGRLGEGGMGVVYLAEQAEPRRRVALKLIRGAQPGDELQRRLFAREVQALARLNHPNIATIYEAGRTAQGEPYFAMEHVAGVDLLTFVNRPRPQSLRSRLELVGRIARAVGHAHERGIVHRDLKPGNVLVIPGADGAAAGGVPKILDFGLARVLDAETDVRATRAGTIVGTLAYMSPEQARGDLEAVDIRTDVYSLGVLLYELTTGVLPIDVSSGGLVGAVRRIQQEAPRDPRAWNAALPRDVALITLKCLAKQPEQRYASAVELAAELDRYLSGHPIHARPPSPFYRAQRFLARNALAVSLLTLLFVAVSIGALVATIQAQRIAQQRDRVAAEALKVARLNGVLENLWQSVDPWRAGDRDVRVLDVLQNIARRVEEEMRDTPLLAADVRNTLGNTWRSLGTRDDYAESERHLRFALETRRAHHGELSLETAQSANDLAETLYWSGAFEEAQALLAKAIETRRRLLPPQDPLLAESLNNLGGVLKQLGALDRAAACYGEALAIRQRAYQAALADAQLSQRERAAAAEALAETRNNRGALHRARAQRFREGGDATSADAALAAAFDDYRAALELRRVWLGQRHPSTATSHNNLGRALQDAGRYSESEVHLRQALEILRAGVGDSHQLVARALHNLARLMRDMGEPAAARSLATDAHAMRAKLFGPEHRETQESAALLRELSDSTGP